MNQLTIEQALQIAVQHHQAGRLAEAESLYRQILAHQPDHAQALHHLGVIAGQAGRNDVALDLIGQAIAIQPDFPEAHSNRGEALRGQGRLDEAIAAYRQAIALQHDFPDAHYNLSIALIEKEQFDEAIAACRQAIALQPGYPEACNNLGVALKAEGRLDEAIAAYHQAIALKSTYPNAHNNLGVALIDQGQTDEAIAAFRRAVEYDPHDHSIHSNLVFFLNYHPNSDPRTLYDEACRWHDRHAAPLAAFVKPHSNPRILDRRLRIGYVSADFCAHPSANFLIPLLLHHDPQQVEFVCYAHVVRPDSLTRRFQEISPHWRDTVPLSDSQMADLIRQDRIDILVDLKLHTRHNRLTVFARKPAPVQVTWLGYPGTTGLTTIDYRFTDPYLDPPGTAETLYSEQTLTLPDTFWCYDPLTNDPAVNPLPALTIGRRTGGGTTFGGLNHLCKVNDALLQLWARVLRASAGATLLLLAPEGNTRARVLDRLQQEGIAPSRIEFIARTSYPKYLELYQRIDLCLDTFPCNGHTTTLDALWMGVPVITLVGNTALGRAGLSQLTNLGLPELIARTPDQFVQIATDLAHDLPRLAELRSSLRQRMQASPLMDAPKFARAIESAYRTIWRRYCSRRL